MRYLVTGGAGFIGSAVVREAIAAGHSVCVFDKLTYAGNVASLAPVANSESFEFRQADIWDAEAACETLQNWRQLFIPRNFAHGFCTLTENVEFLYRVSAPYSAAHDRGVAWDDPDIAVGWPVAPGAVVLLDKDRTWPALRDLERVFEREAA